MPQVFFLSIEIGINGFSEIVCSVGFHQSVTEPASFIFLYLWPSNRQWLIAFRRFATITFKVLIAASSSSRRPTIGRVDYSAFSRRWSSVPLEDLFASKCDDVDDLLAAYDQFKALYHRHAIALSSANYVTLTLLLNRKLEYMLCLSSNRQLVPQFREIEAELHFFVRLVSEAELSSQATKDDTTFSAAKAIIHCLLYYRIGDYHMALFKHKEINELAEDFRPTRNFLVALGAYAFALYSLRKDRAGQSTTGAAPDARPDVEAIEALLAAELITLVEGGLKIPTVSDEFERLCLDEVLPFRLLYADDCRARAEFDNWLVAYGQSGGALSGNFIVDNVRQRSRDVGDIRRLLAAGWLTAEPSFGYGTLAFRPRLLRRLVLLVGRDPAARRQLLKVLFRDTDVHEILPTVDARGRRDAPTGVNRISCSDVGQFFRLLASNCSLAWYSNTIHTRDFEPPAGSALDSRLAAVTFPYLLHRDVRPSDECIWTAVQKVAAGVEMCPNERQTLTEYLTKLSALSLPADDADWRHSEDSQPKELRHTLQSDEAENGEKEGEVLAEQENRTSVADVGGSNDGNKDCKIVYEPLSPDGSCSSTAEYIVSPQRHETFSAADDVISLSDDDDGENGGEAAETSHKFPVPIDQTPKPMEPAVAFLDEDTRQHLYDEEYDEEQEELILQYCSDVEAFSLQFDCITLMGMSD